MVSFSGSDLALQRGGSLGVCFYSRPNKSGRGWGTSQTPWRCSLNKRVSEQPLPSLFSPDPELLTDELVGQLQRPGHPGPFPAGSNHCRLVQNREAQLPCGRER